MSGAGVAHRVARAALVAGCAALAAAAAPRVARAGAFIDATEQFPDRITHPSGYTGSGGLLTVDVCIDPTSANAAQMVVPVQNLVKTYNERVMPFGTVFLNFNNGVPGGTIDFESVALHEVGHCLGLAHANLASEGGFPDPSDPDSDYAKAGDGANNVWDLAPGADGRIASRDDVRGDDVGLLYFDKATNDPFRLSAAVVDATTYSRQAADLPVGSTFAATATRFNGASFAVGSTEAVMNQGTYYDEEQRLLTADDVSALRYAMSGLDEAEGTSDDYDLQLVYGGFGTGCDIVLDFDASKTDFAVCGVTTQRIGNLASQHYRITNADVYFHPTSVAWYFNAESCGNGALEGAETCDDGNTMHGDGCDQRCRVETGYACAGAPSVCAPVCGNGDVQGPTEACDDGGTAAGDGCDALCQVEPGWTCGGEPSICGAAACGDGLVAGVEACDDGGASPGDGCDAACQLEPGWVCGGAPSSCGAAECGDGWVAGLEACDDGGSTPGDGCDATCQIEPGYRCSGPPSTCTAPQVPALGAPQRALLALALGALGFVALAFRGRRRTA